MHEHKIFISLSARKFIRDNFIFHKYVQRHLRKTFQIILQYRVIDYQTMSLKKGIEDIALAY
jgi:hypothetical protein